MAKRSPPIPLEVGSVTLSTALAAIAASMAEPPRSRMSAPAYLTGGNHTVLRGDDGASIGTVLGGQVECGG